MAEQDTAYDIQSSAGSAAPGPLAPAGISMRVWAAFGVLLLLALAVIFVLPRLVTEYELPFTRRAAVVDPAVIVQASNVPLNAVSPFDEAQRARQRKEAQDVLASLLALQLELDEVGAEVWAEEAYQTAVEFARIGDEGYRSQQFALATENYQQAEQIFSDLSASTPEVFDRYLEEGELALQQGNASSAEQSFTIALQIEPGSAEASSGLQRAQSLDEVMRLLREGRREQEAGELQQAQTLFQQAVALDGNHEGSRDALAQVRSAIADQEFGAVMSQGFAALQNNQSEPAIAAFERALRMRPGSQQAQQALAQTRDQLAISRINKHQQNAGEHEAAEQWQLAVQEYDAALSVDSNLVFANEGRDYAQKRLQLDLLLEDALNRPERLAESAVYEQAAGVYYAGRDLESPGPRLQQQLRRLEVVLREAKIPVEVQLISDNATQVTLFQIGDLGQFSDQVLTLQPGRYVAVGTRPGYRDVRKEFVVGFGYETEPVTIRCNELIAAGRS
jgi:tetratricopeptide (TPR) repeat protein